MMDDETDEIAVAEQAALQNATREQQHFQSHAYYYDSQAHVTPHHAHPHLYTPSGSGSPTFHLPSHAAFPSSIMPAPWPTSGSADSTCPPTGVIPDAAIYHTPTTPQFHRPTSHTVAVLQRAASDPFIASGASSSAIATAAQQHPASPHPHLHQDADHRPHSHSHPPHLHHHPQGPATGMPPTPFSPSAATYSTLLSPSSPLSPSSTATTTSGEGMFHPHLSHASSSPSMSTSPTTGLHPHRPTPLQQQSVHPGHVMAVPSTRSAHLRRTTSAGLVPLSFHPPPPPPLRHAHSSHHASTMSPSSSSSSSGGPYHGLGIASAMDFGSGASFGSVGDAGGPVAGSSSQRTTATGGPMRLSMPLTRQAKRLRIAKHEPMSNMTAIGGDVHSQDHDDDDDDDDDDNDDEDDMEEEERGQPRPQHLLRSAGPSTRTNSTSTSTSASVITTPGSSIGVGGGGGGGMRLTDMRQSRLESERRRRDTLRDHLDDLRLIIPPIPGTGKLTKTKILERTITFIQNLQMEKEELSLRVGFLESQNALLSSHLHHPPPLPPPSSAAAAAAAAAAGAVTPPPSSRPASDSPSTTA